MLNISPEENHSLTEPNDEGDKSHNLNQTILEEYRTLFNLPKVTEHQAKRITEILNLARQDRQIDIMISHIIFEDGQKQGLSSEKCFKSYNDQMAALREYQDTNFSGLDNTMFGNTMATLSNIQDHNHIISEDDITQLKIALQKEDFFAINQAQLLQ